MSDWTEIGKKTIGLDGPPLPATAAFYLAYASALGREEITHTYNVNTCQFTALREDGPVEVVDDNGIEIWIKDEVAAFLQNNILSVASATDKGVSQFQPSVYFYMKKSSTPTRLATLTKAGGLAAYKFTQVASFEDSGSGSGVLDSLNQFRFFNGATQIASIGPNGVKALLFEEAAVLGDSGGYFSDENQNLISGNPNP